MPCGSALWVVKQINIFLKEHSRSNQSIIQQQKIQRSLMTSNKKSQKRKKPYQDIRVFFKHENHPHQFRTHR